MTQSNNKFEPLFVSSKQALDHYWPNIEPLLERYIAKAALPEQSVANIYDKVINGQNYMFLVKADTVDGPEVDLVMVCELLEYTGFSALNITALSGRNLMLYARKYWGFVCGWAYMVGVRAFEGFIPPALERLVGKLGFEKPRSYIKVRKMLGEDNA